MGGGLTVCREGRDGGVNDAPKIEENKGGAWGGMGGGGETLPCALGSSMSCFIVQTCKLLAGIRLGKMFKPMHEKALSHFQNLGVPCFGPGPQGPRPGVRNVNKKATC